MKDKGIEEIKNEFISKFCNDHNGEIRFLRSIFYDEKDGAEEILNFISQALSQYKDSLVEEIENKVPVRRNDGSYMIDDTTQKVGLPLVLLEDVIAIIKEEK